MHLTYRGVSYTAPLLETDAAERHQSGVYHRPPCRTLPLKSALRYPGETLIYRGVHYRR